MTDNSHTEERLIDTMEQLLKENQQQEKALLETEHDLTLVLAACVRLSIANQGLMRAMRNSMHGLDKSKTDQERIKAQAEAWFGLQRATESLDDVASKALERIRKKRADKEAQKEESGAADS